ncbi:MAG: glycosyltransferase WbuB [Bacteroides oleiciplenus]|nr:glycosyltransferase WbuB [Bacteroides oleiciplenus]
MNILFLTMSSSMQNIEDRGIYTDLMRKFRDEGHEVYIIYPLERRMGLYTEVTVKNHMHLLGVKTLNLTKTNIIEKGMGQVLLEYQFKVALKRYFGTVKFDLILYSTPPITFTKVIRYAKKHNPEALSYLMLKDIFPQNAVDLDMFSKSSFYYKIFRKKEKRLYEISDFIGCMSPANVNFVLKHNPEVDASKMEICPNAIEVINQQRVDRRNAILQRLQLPMDKVMLIYGGNLGKPQGVDFLLEVIEENEKRKDTHIVVVGNGTEYQRIKLWFDEKYLQHATLISHLPRADYDELVRSCDIGMIFLDKRFTIPNYPSRLLSYLENKMPVLMATDLNTDIGSIAERNGYGMWTESGSIVAFMNMIDEVATDKFLLKEMGEKGYRFLKDNYTVAHAYGIIMKHLQ